MHTKPISVTQPDSTNLAIQLTGANSTTPKAIYQIPALATIAAYPTAAGTATVYYSTSPPALCQQDVIAAKFDNSGVAHWRAWTAGAVTADTTASLSGAITAAALVPASGTWTIEAVR